MAQHTAEQATNNNNTLKTTGPECVINPHIPMSERLTVLSTTMAGIFCAASIDFCEGASLRNTDMISDCMKNLTANEMFRGWS